MAQAEGYEMGPIARFLTALRRLEKELELNANPRLALEVLMLDLPPQRRKEGAGVSRP